jgi:hypothetical protein
VFSFSISEIVTVLVGKNKRPYYLHKDILVNNSEFFRKCLSIGMAEQTHGRIELPEDSCRGFDILVQWLYSKTVSHVFKYEDVDLAIRAYVLADKYAMHQACNSIIDALKAYWKRMLMYPDHFTWISKHADDASPLLNLACAMLASDLVREKEKYQHDIEGNGSAHRASGLKKLLAVSRHASMLLWAVTQVDPKAAQPDPTKGCQYHVHGPNEFCKAAKKGLSKATSAVPRTT